MGVERSTSIEVLVRYFILHRDQPTLTYGISGSTPKEYLKAFARREIACVERLEKHLRPIGFFNGPGCYHPSPPSKDLSIKRISEGCRTSPTC